MLAEAGRRFAADAGRLLRFAADAGRLDDVARGIAAAAAPRKAPPTHAIAQKSCDHWQRDLMICRSTQGRRGSITYKIRLHLCILLSG